MATVTVMFTIAELRLRTGVSEEELTEIVGLGMIKPHQPQAETWLFDDSAVTIVHRAVRLHSELELDWSGIMVALILLDESARLTRESRLLQQRLVRFLAHGQGDIPGGNVPPSCRMAATSYPVYKLSTAQAGEFPGSRRSALPGLSDWAHYCTGSVGPRKRSVAGHGRSQGTACMPGGGYALPGPQTTSNLPLHWIRRPAQAQHRRVWPQPGSRLYAGWRLRLVQPTN